MERKKMSLANLTERLSRNEMKLIIAGSGVGGTGSGTCGAYVPSGQTYNNVAFQASSLRVHGYPSGSPSYTFKGVSQSQALALIQGIPGARYCCDGCSTASWYNY